MDSPNAVGVPSLASFPTTKPAMLFKTTFNKTYMCGDIHSGSTLIVVPLVTGTLESTGDFEPKLKFNINSGADWFQIDADKKHGRMCVKAVASDEEGVSICLNAEGVIAMNEITMPLAFGAPDAKPSPFGFGVELFKIETGADKYKALENMVFAGSQRFTQEEGGMVGVEARISLVVPGGGME